MPILSFDMKIRTVSVCVAAAFNSMNVNDIIELSMHPMLHVDFYDDIYFHSVECSSNTVSTWKRI